MVKLKSATGCALDLSPAEPDFWAVWSATGMHIGTWPDEADARAALAEYEGRIPRMSGLIKPLYAAPSNPVISDGIAWQHLQSLTFAVQHSPNCPSPYLVRLPGASGLIDMKPYGDPLGLKPSQTGDVLGFGKTLEQAAAAALSVNPQSGSDKP